MSGSCGMGGDACGMGGAADKADRAEGGKTLEALTAGWQQQSDDIGLRETAELRERRDEAEASPSAVRGEVGRRD
eukprot:CAMPEP_0174730032 /NCGR_PEP_ID=MMETSP1094-20130205/54802_1 /TAXON_ID=156173 /ORGANISM="Chrysochromulina brevifilum, Strain UTEX LB 985" /LENGTH=74 /DNA_ID=CAMNT_0015932225 /DNA_START=244 /DNA_END=467 /DNA_ORIENTATION=+